MKKYVLTVGFLSSGNIIWFLGRSDNLFHIPPNQPVEAGFAGAAGVGFNCFGWASIFFSAGISSSPKNGCFFWLGSDIWGWDTSC